MERNLEKLAKDRGKLWTDSELVSFVHEGTRPLSPAATVAHLRTTLSKEALASIQQAASSVVQNTPADSEGFAIRYVTPEAPVHIGQDGWVPMEFVRYVASALSPAANV